MTFKIHPAAREELDQAINWYDAAAPGKGNELGQRVADCFAQIVALPMSCAAVQAGCRRCMVKRFPYGVVYLVEEQRVIVYAVMHLRRKPGYWTARLGTE